MNTPQTIPRCPHCKRRCKKSEGQGFNRQWGYGYNATCGRDECIRASLGHRSNVPFIVGVKPRKLQSLAFISKCVTCGEPISKSSRILKHCKKHAQHGRFTSKIAHNSQAMNDHALDQLKRSERNREKQEQIRKFRELCNTKLKTKE